MSDNWVVQNLENALEEWNDKVNVIEYVMDQGKSVI